MTLHMVMTLRHIKGMIHERKKVKNSSVKDTWKRMRKQAIDWEKTLGKDIYNKRLLFETYEELIKVNAVKK